jgi:LPS export ABC transporter protein LptC
MRRRRLRRVLLIGVLTALGGIAYLVLSSVSARIDPVRVAADLLPQVAQRIQNFRRVKVKDGRTVWEITADDAQYFEDDNQIIVHEPRVTFFLKDGGRPCHISGSEGKLSLDGREIDSVTIGGGVSVALDDLVLETDEATYDRERDLITSPGAVVVRSRSLEVHGKGMEISVGPQQLRLLGDVHTTVRSDAATS